MSLVTRVGVETYCMEIFVRKYQEKDDRGLREMMAEHIKTDKVWPPPDARGKDMAWWLGEKCDGGRWVATTPEGKVVGHVGVHMVKDERVFTLVAKRVGGWTGEMSEIVRGVVHPDYRNSEVARHLTAQAMGWVISCGLLPVATAFSDRTGAIALMETHGWVQAGFWQSKKHQHLKVLVYAPDAKVVTRVLQNRKTKWD